MSVAAAAVVVVSDCDLCLAASFSFVVDLMRLKLFGNFAFFSFLILLVVMLQSSALWRVYASVSPFYFPFDFESFLSILLLDTI